MQHIRKWIRKIKRTAIARYRAILASEMVVTFMNGKTVHAAAFTAPQNLLDGVQWAILAGQFAIVAYAAIKLSPIAWAFISNRQQKVEEGKDGVQNIAIGLAIGFVGLWILKQIVETMGGTYPLPI